MSGSAATKATQIVHFPRSDRPLGPFGMRLSIGNRKVGGDTLTLNMGSATDCPADKLGLCAVQNRFQGRTGCFSKHTERYQHVLPRRRLQEEYWKNTPIATMIEDLKAIFEGFNGTRSRIKYFRFNESGDFWDQDSVNKANELTEYLKYSGIITYCNSARSDLNFSDVNFLIRGSGWNGPNGETRVLLAGEPIPSGFHVCPADCVRCGLCKLNHSNIVYIYHGPGRKKGTGKAAQPHARLSVKGVWGFFKEYSGRGVMNGIRTGVAEADGKRIEGQIVRYPHGLLVAEAVGAPQERATSRSPLHKTEDLPETAHHGPNGSMARKLLAIRDTLPEEIQPLVSYEPVEKCLIKGVQRLSKIACILRQVANRMQRTIMNSYSTPRSGSKRITKAQYATCEKCGMWLSDEDYTEIRRSLGKGLRIPPPRQLEGEA